MNQELQEWCDSLTVDQMRKEIKVLRLILQSHGQIIEINTALKKHLDFLLNPYSSPEEVMRRRFEVYEALKEDS